MVETDFQGAEICVSRIGEVQAKEGLTVESHQASVKNIPPEKLSEIRLLLANSPRGSYCDLIKQCILTLVSK
jgi:hypothetical protein